MKKAVFRLVSFITTVVLILTATPVNIFAQTATFEQIVNASVDIIVYNEGTYTTVINNDNGSVSLGKICWHGTNALNLLKKVVAKNPSQALNILGSALYNEIITSSSWDNRITTNSEAAALSILLATNESHEVQDVSAYEYVSGYVTLGQSAGITEAQSLVFFADYANQNGRTGAVNFYKKVLNTYGEINLATLYAGSSQNSRRTRTYNFCATINWTEYSDPSKTNDTASPVITNVTVSDVTSEGFTVSCDITDNTSVSEVYFAVHHEDDGIDGINCYIQNPQSPQVSHTVNVSDFMSRSGNYIVYIYAFDQAGNYAYAVLNPINVPSSVNLKELTLAVFTNNASFIGEEIIWNASASGGSGNYLYQFILYKDGKKIAERKYSDYSVFKYVTSETGTYSVEVSVYDSTSDKSTSCTGTDVTIHIPIIIDSFSGEKSKYQTGQIILWKIDAHGGSGELQYAYTVYKDEEVVLSTTYSKDNQFTYTPEESGTYYVTANIKDAELQVISHKSDEITVFDPLSVTELTFLKNYAIMGMPVTCKADIQGGTGGYTCIFDIYKDGEFLMSSDKTNATEFTFTVPDSGTYTAKITVTDADSHTATGESDVLTAGSSVQKGDADCDGKITPADARLILRHAVSLEILPEYTQGAADADNNGEITPADARTILRISCGLE